jgi:hypothetical protein
MPLEISGSDGLGTNPAVCHIGMTLRIDILAGPGPATIRLSGWLSEAEVPDLEATVVKAGLPLRVDVGQLAGADALGVRALQRLRGRGAYLAGASPYIGLLLEEPAGEAEGETEKE